MKKLLTSLALCLPIIAFGQEATARDVAMIKYLKDEATQHKDLSLPKEATELGMFSSYANAIFKPKGEGPFPAVVLTHSCGGLREKEMAQWVEEGLKQGYVVLVLDSMRGSKNNCFRPLAVTNGRRLKDILDAHAHLSKMPNVDAQKIGSIGFSQGAMMSAMLASKSASEAVRPETKRFAATVGLYGFCYVPKGSFKHDPQLSLSFLMQDTDKPFLHLMGRLDNETPPTLCEEAMPDLKAKGAPVEWHIYENATHCWDCIGMDGFSKTDFKGDKIIYKFDKAVTADSIQRSYRFLNERMQVDQK